VRAVLAGLLLLGCGGSTPALKTVTDDPTDMPLAAATADERATFKTGDARFDAVFLEADGLGPLYVRSACNSCHELATRGPGAVEKMGIVEADGITASPDQSALKWGHSVRPYVAGGGKTPVVPDMSIAGLKLSSRMGLPVFGRGYMEAVDDAEILRVEKEQAARSDGIHGVANQVIYASQPNPDTSFHTHQPGDRVIGRFGLKARQPTLDDFAADAAQGDMGMTSPLRPDELPNPDGLTDDAKPGVDLDIDTINLLANYTRLLEIPKRPMPDAHARQLFDETLCSVCHVPTMKTRADYPIAALAGIDAPIYTDLLLHDMGDALADGLTDGSSSSRQWRTAPLIGLSHLRSYMHDGRARTIEDAIVAHGGEAAQSAQKFMALSESDRAALVDFVSGL
jgi:CxxC motif-containing protein (DUF1111 family)